jgi:hypothetical protein
MTEPKESGKYDRRSSLRRGCMTELVREVEGNPLPGTTSPFREYSPHQARFVGSLTVAVTSGLWCWV